MDEKEKTARLVLYTGWGFAIASFAFLFIVTFLPLPTTGVEHAKTIVGFLLGVGGINYPSILFWIIKWIG